MDQENKNTSNSQGSDGALKHWLHQRFSAVFLVLFTYWIFSFSMALSHAESNAIIAIVKAPVNLIMLLLFVVISFYHASLGMQVVIEDYVHHNSLKLFALFAVHIFTAMTVMAFIIALIYLINS
jgi:succinate dehydrogenase / fumarate reductase membrane anchor subunit